MNKEYYFEEIIKAADKIKEKAEYYLQDYNDAILSLDITIHIEPAEITQIKLNKEYGVF